MVKMMKTGYKLAAALAVEDTDNTLSKLLLLQFRWQWC